MGEAIKTITFVVLGSLLTLVFLKSCDKKANPIVPIVMEFSGVESKSNILPVTIIREKNIQKYTDRYVDSLRSALFASGWDSSQLSDMIDSVGCHNLAVAAADYFSRKSFIDTTFIDTIGYIVISDSIFMNSITKRTINYNLAVPVTKFQKKSYFSLLATVGGNRSMFDCLAGVGLTNKKDVFFGYTYGAISKTHNITFAYPLKFRK